MPTAVQLRARVGVAADTDGCKRVCAHGVGAANPHGRLHRRAAGVQRHGHAQVGHRSPAAGEEWRTVLHVVVVDIGRGGVRHAGARGGIRDGRGGHGAEVSVACVQRVRAAAVAERDARREQPVRLPPAVQSAPVEHGGDERAVRAGVVLVVLARCRLVHVQLQCVGGRRYGGYSASRGRWGVAGAGVRATPPSGRHGVGGTPRQCDVRRWQTQCANGSAALFLFYSRG